MIHPGFDLSTLSVVHTLAKGKTILLHRHCVKLCFGFEWRDRSLCAGAHQQLHSSKLKSGACVDRMPLCSAGQKLWKLRTRPPGLWAARPPGRTGQLAPSVPLLLPLFVCIFFFHNQSHSVIVIDAFIRGLKKREDALSMSLRDP